MCIQDQNTAGRKKSPALLSNSKIGEGFAGRNMPGEDRGLAGGTGDILPNILVMQKSGTAPTELLVKINNRLELI